MGPWSRIATHLLFIGILHGQVSIASADVPTTWLPRGLGGGGAMYGISFSPHNNDLFVACDMSEMFHSTNRGDSWEILPADQMQTNQRTVIRFTSDPTKTYGGDGSAYTGGGFAPMKSSDGGVTWNPLGSDPTGGTVLAIYADFAQPNRLVLADDSILYFSSDGGDHFSPEYSVVNPQGLFVGGVVFDGNDIYVATSDGLVVSHDGGTSFGAEAAPGIPGGEIVGAIAGARDAGGLVLLAATYTSLSAARWQGQNGSSYVGLYRRPPGASTWTASSSGMTANTRLTFLAMSEGNATKAYAMGYDGSTTQILIYRSSDGGVSWTPSLLTSGNQNIETGWSGEPVVGSFRRWWDDWGGAPNFFAVSAIDANLAAFDDGGFVHRTTDGGSTWQALYIPPAERNPAGTPVVYSDAFHSNGLENTVSYWVLWLDSLNLLTGYADIQGARSSDGGQSWSPYVSNGGTAPASPDGLKDFNQLVRHPTSGIIYASTASVGPLYRGPIITDALLDSPGGRVVFSTDNGSTWKTLHDFGHPVSGIALDPTNAQRMYAGVVHHTLGGIQVSNDIDNGTSSTWSPIAAPNLPRMEGHPQSLQVLNDGTLVVTYSARQPVKGGGFTNSSGVFVLPPNSTVWQDRSDSKMMHYTRTLTIDPHDSDQSNWYVGTFDSFNNGANNIPGGFYRSTNWGGNWQKILSQTVESSTINPLDPDEMYVATDRNGLWHTQDLSSQQPTFVPVSTYPFRGLERVFFHPSNGEVWVLSFGNGIRVGVPSTATPTPSITPTASPTITLTLTSTPTISPTSTSVPSQTSTVTPTMTETVTATPSETVTETPTPVATLDDTPSPTETAVATAAVCASGISISRPKLSWRLSSTSFSFKGEAVIPKPWIGIDPVANGIRLVLADNAMTFDWPVPGGSKWSVRGSSRWAYKDASGSAFGITSIALSDKSKSHPGQLRWSIRGKIPTNVLPGPTMLQTVIWLGLPGECASIAWNPPGNASPGCSNAGGKLRCR